ncbi:CU044_2847 family protein [Streptomyces sp. 12297]|uniref:CU044_2847 family protein n=1 Tax=Streptomyces sp. NBC_00239 TaxID=2903640 RepID=UPI002E285E7D|nr:CU044_2847 family protein [Streptomyces sp. NBC_00239]
MSEIVEVQTPDGGTLWVRVEDEGGPRDTSFTGVRHRLDDLPETLATVVATVRSGLRSAAPDELTLEFGIELSLKSGLLVSVVTASGGKATLKVSATWRRNGDAVASAQSAESAETPEPAETAEPAGAAETARVPETAGAPGAAE